GGGFGEFGRIDRHVSLNLSRREDGLAVEPAHRPLIRHLDSGEIAIIFIINLRRGKTDLRIRVAHMPHQPPGLDVEVQIDGSATVDCSLDDLHILIVDLYRGANAPLREGLLDGGWKAEGG